MTPPRGVRFSRDDEGKNLSKSLNALQCLSHSLYRVSGAESSDIELVLDEPDEFKQAPVLTHLLSSQPG